MVDEPQFLGDLLADAGDVLHDRPALHLPHEAVSYSALKAKVEQLVDGLIRADVGRGDRIATLLQNSADGVALLFACAQVGVVCVPLNSRHRPDDLAHILADCAPRLVFTHDTGREHTDLRRRLLDALALLAEAERPTPPTAVDLSPRSHPSMAGRREFLEGTGTGRSPYERMAEPGDPLVLLYTSGTTSHPKGCALSQTQLLAVSSAVATMWPMHVGDVVWDPLPMCHISGIMPLLATLLERGTFVTTPHFEAGEAIEMIRQHRPTRLWPAFTTVWQEVLAHEDFEAEAFSSVRSVLCIGPFDTLDVVQRRLPSAPVVNCYGLTEAVGVSFMTSADDPDQVRLGCSGRPVTGLEASIRDPSTNRVVPEGERGELWLRGRPVIDAYVNDDSHSSGLFDGDGWLRTGDLGRISRDGLFTYEGREKDMLKVGGENVAAAEIEALVSTYPDVKLCAVVGIPDEQYGEVPVLFVEAMPHASAMDESALVGYCAERAPGYKVPRHVIFVDEWPMSTTKIMKGELHRRALEEFAA